MTGIITYVVVALAAIAATWPAIYLISRLAREISRRGPLRMSVKSESGVFVSFKVDPHNPESIKKFLEKAERISGKKLHRQS